MQGVLSIRKTNLKPIYIFIKPPSMEVLVSIWSSTRITSWSKYFHSYVTHRNLKGVKYKENQTEANLYIHQTTIYGSVGKYMEFHKDHKLVQIFPFKVTYRNMKNVLDIRKTNLKQIHQTTIYGSIGKYMEFHKDQELVWIFPFICDTEIWKTLYIRKTSLKPIYSSICHLCHCW